MPRLLLSGIKMLVALSLLYFSGVYRIPVILFVCFFWCAWLWLVVSKWRERLLATLGFTLIPLGWWCFSLWSHFAEKGEVSHLSEGRAYWGGMATASTELGCLLAVTGLFLLAYVDYRRPLKPKAIKTLVPKETKTDENLVWPPAPKQPPLG